MSDYAKDLIKWRRRRERIKILRAKGKTLTQIAAAIKISRQRVYQILKVVK